MQFLGFNIGDTMPDENTIRHFRDRLVETKTLRLVRNGGSGRAFIERSPKAIRCLRRLHVRIRRNLRFGRGLNMSLHTRRTALVCLSELLAWRGPRPS